MKMKGNEVVDGSSYIQTILISLKITDVYEHWDYGYMSLDTYIYTQFTNIHICIDIIDAFAYPPNQHIDTHKRQMTT